MRGGAKKGSLGMKKIMLQEGRDSWTLSWIPQQALLHRVNKIGIGDGGKQDLVLRIHNRLQLGKISLDHCKWW
jgi:hypothetical protein